MRAPRLASRVRPGDGSLTSLDSVGAAQVAELEDLSLALLQVSLVSFKLVECAHVANLSLPFTIDSLPKREGKRKPEARMSA